jgi:hypothetical protein
VAYITDAQARAAVASALKLGSLPTPSNWDEIVPAAHLTAVNQLLSFAAGRGFTGLPAGWVAGPDFERDLSVYWALVDGAGLWAYDPTWVEKRNRLKELAATTITDSSGAVIAPAGPGAAAAAGELTGKTDPLPWRAADPWCGRWGW